MARLSVTIDGAPLSDDEARAFWQRFSAYMDEHKGDLAGFAQSEGLASVHPKTSPAGALLVGSRSAPQGAYATAPRSAAAESGGGGGARRERSRKNRGA
ncbi:MAG: hypothetical protein JNL38_40895 [Myxococcales bacterium]|nr:hypothetical protein [Myxococcales bacterium]